MSDFPGVWAQVIFPLAATKLLTQRPSHGYELAQRLRAAGFGTISGGTLYPLLRRLEEEGMVESDWEHPMAGPARKRYFLTPCGLELAGQLTTEWRLHADHVARFLTP